MHYFVYARTGTAASVSCLPSDHVTSLRVGLYTSGVYVLFSLESGRHPLLDKRCALILTSE